jgi:hypothetical protein
MLPDLPSPLGENDNITSSSMSPFLRLPRELHDQIYDYYFQCDDGYMHHFESNTPTQADGQPIPLSLTLDCRQIQSEVEELALRLNTIVSESSYTKSTQEDAARYQQSSRYVMLRKLAMLDQVAPALLDAKTTNFVAMLYPQFRPMLEYWRTYGGLNLDVLLDLLQSEPTLTWSDFNTYALGLLSEDPKFVEISHIRRRTDPACKGNEALELINAWPEP